MSGKTIIAIVGDLHIGGNTALATPEFEIHTRNAIETQIIKANQLQLWLWDCWTDYWKHVFELVEDDGQRNKFVVVFLGDIREGVHHGSPQLMQESTDQHRLAVNILQPIVDRASEAYGVFGTATHGGVAAAEEAAIYRELSLTDFGYRIILEADGIIHDFAHHGRAGRRPWTSAGAGFVTEVMVDYAVMNRKLPNYIWRAHNHIIDDSGLKMPNTRFISTPSFQLKTDFGNRVSSGTYRSDIGGFIMDGARLDDSKARYFGQPDIYPIRSIA